ncbi:MAG: hypothetical protein AB7V46_12160, partial [Thermomicrobiales bacterium]
MRTRHKRQASDQTHVLPATLSLMNPANYVHKWTSFSVDEKRPVHSWFRDPCDLLFLEPLGTSDAGMKRFALTNLH